MVPSKENPRLNPSALLYTRTLVQTTVTSCLEQCNGLLPLIFLLSLFTPWPAYPFKNLSQITSVLLKWLPAFTGQKCYATRPFSTQSISYYSPPSSLLMPCCLPCCCSAAPGVLLTLELHVCHPLSQECSSFFESRSSVPHLLQVLRQTLPSSWGCPWPAYLKLQSHSLPHSFSSFLALFFSTAFNTVYILYILYVYLVFFSITCFHQLKCEQHKDRYLYILCSLMYP